MLNMRISTIAFTCQGQMHGADETINNIVIDSRAVEAGDLFVALQGEHSDGHDYLEAALAKGALAAIVERPMDVAISQIIVSDAVKANSNIHKILFIFIKRCPPRLYYTLYSTMSGDHREIHLLFS